MLCLPVLTSRKCVPHVLGTVPHRTVTGGMGGKIVILGLVAATYFIFNSIQRTRVQQIRKIRRRFMSPPSFDFPMPLLHRTEEEQKLIKYFRNPPAGPLVILGPDGTGKTSTLKYILNKRPMSMFLDLRQLPATSPNEFIHHFIEETGYLVPASDFFTRWLLREKDMEKKPRISREEVDKALVSIQKMLQSEKARGWKQGVPVLCVNDIEDNILPEKDGKTVFPLDHEFSKFLNFCLWMSDNRLAHVVLTTNRTFSEKYLDVHPGWASRREIFFLGHVRKEVATEYLRGSINEYLENNFRKKLSETEITFIVENLGGNMLDISRALFSVIQENLLTEAVYQMVSDSVSFVKSKLEATLEGDGDGREKKFLRFWEMMEKFSVEEIIPRSKLTEDIFYENSSELDHYESIQIILYSYVNLSHNLLELKVSGDTVVVKPWSTRIKVAFQVLVSDPSMKKCKARVEDRIKKNKLKKVKEELIEDIGRILLKKQSVMTPLKLFLENSEKLELVFNKNRNNELIGKQVQQMEGIETQLEVLEKELEITEKQLSVL